MPIEESPLIQENRTSPFITLSSVFLCLFLPKPPQILLYTAFGPSSKHFVRSPTQFHDALPPHPIMSLMELITFLWQTQEEPGQGAPFLR